MIQYFIDIILVRFPDPLVQSESGNLTIKPSPYLAGPSLHFTLLSCLLSIVLIFICPVSSPTPFCPISLFDFPYRAFWFVLSQLFHPFSSAGPWPIFSGQSPLLKSRSRSGHLSVFSAFKRRWWREWRQSKVDHGAITVKEELVWWNTGDVSFCWTKWHHINQMLPKKWKEFWRKQQKGWIEDIYPAAIQLLQFAWKYFTAQYTGKAPCHIWY